MQVLKAIWDFIQTQILGMKWLNDLIGSGLSALGLDLENRWVNSAQFFLYDVIKITVLLCIIGPASRTTLPPLARAASQAA